MDCDNQLRIVKRNDHPNPLVTDTADIGPLPVSTELNAIRRGDEPFGVGNRHTDLPRPILDVPREAHMGIRPKRTNLAPL